MNTKGIYRVVVRRKWIEYPTWIPDEMFVGCVRRFRWDHWVLVQGPGHKPGPDRVQEHWDLEDWVLETPEHQLILLASKKLRAAQREADGIIIRWYALQRGIKEAMDGVAIL